MKIDDEFCPYVTTTTYRLIEGPKDNTQAEGLDKSNQDRML